MYSGSVGYLLNLQEQNKWTNKHQNLSIGRAHTADNLKMHHKPAKLGLIKLMPLLAGLADFVKKDLVFTG